MLLFCLDSSSMCLLQVIVDRSSNSILTHSFYNQRIQSYRIQCRKWRVWSSSKIKEKTTNIWWKLKIADSFPPYALSCVHQRMWRCSSKWRGFGGVSRFFHVVRIYKMWNLRTKYTRPIVVIAAGLFFCQNQLLNPGVHRALANPGCLA